MSLSSLRSLFARSQGAAKPFRVFRGPQAAGTRPGYGRPWVHIRCHSCPHAIKNVKHNSCAPARWGDLGTADLSEMRGDRSDAAAAGQGSIRQPRSPRVLLTIADTSAGGLLLTHSTLRAGALASEWNAAASCDVDELQRLRGARVQSVRSPSAGTSLYSRAADGVQGSRRDLVRSTPQPHGAHAQTQTRARRGTIAGLRWPSSSRRYG